MVNRLLPQKDVEGATSEVVESICCKLDNLRRLEPNWDQEAAPRIEVAIIDAAKNLVRRLPSLSRHQTYVVPTPTGGVQLEWSHDNGAKGLELEFESADSILYLQWQPEAGIEQADTLDVSDTGRIAELIAWFEQGLG